jgi:hypothetical protein
LLLLPDIDQRKLSAAGFRVHSARLSDATLPFLPRYVFFPGRSVLHTATGEDMRSGRRLVRLWIAGSVFWIIYWVWIYGTKCFHASNGILWCPAGGDPTSTTVVRTAELRYWLLTALPPLWALICGLLLWWAIQGFRRSKERSGDQR